MLAGLNAGELESVNLVEWLAIDMPTLLRGNVAPEVGLADEAAALGAAADALAGLGIVKREKGIGAALYHVLDGARTAQRSSTRSLPTRRIWCGLGPPSCS